MPDFRVWRYNGAMIVAIVLAGGDSSRMKSPKALLKIGKENFAQCIVRKLRECGFDFIYVVAGAQHEMIKKELTGIDVLFNARHQLGQLSSLKEGLRSLPTGSSEALVWPVDQPLVSVETVQLLVDTYHHTKKRLIIPIYETRRGHPVLYDRHAIQAAMALDSARQTAKELQTVFAADTTLLEVEDQAVTIDIDTPEDYKKYITDAGL